MRVACSELREGAVLSRDAVDRNGRLIVARGTALTARHVKGLRTWGISSVEIERGDSEEAAEPEPLDPEEEARIRARFVRADAGDPITSRLIEVCLERAARAGSGA